MAAIFTSYEYGLTELLKRLEKAHPRYAEALTLQARLLENISCVHKYSDSENLRSERNQILEQLNLLSVETLGDSFNELANLKSMTPEPQTGKLHGVLENIIPIMILIPAGRFVMGASPSDGLSSDNEKPQHSCVLSEYRISKYPITNSQYLAFTEATGHCFSASQNNRDKTLDTHLPVTGISWYDCLEYCRWLRQMTMWNFRLPTEAEWEKAARGTDGYLWPWGNEFDERRCNVGSDLFETGPTDVRKFALVGDSPYGISDMVGNVWEWTSSLLMPYPYRKDQRENLDIQTERVLRGGSWRKGARSTRCSCREGGLPGLLQDDIGFRVVFS